MGVSCCDCQSVMLVSSHREEMDMVVYLVVHNEDGFVRRAFSTRESAEQDIASLYKGDYYYHIQEIMVMS